MEIRAWLKALHDNNRVLGLSTDPPEPVSEYQQRQRLAMLKDSVERLVNLLGDLGQLRGAPPHWSIYKVAALPSLEVLLDDFRDGRPDPLPAMTRLIAEDAHHHLLQFKLPEPAIESPQDDPQLTKSAEAPRSKPERRESGRPCKPLSAAEMEALDLYHADAKADSKANRERVYELLGLQNDREKSAKLRALVNRLEAQKYLATKTENRKKTKRLDSFRK